MHCTALALAFGVSTDALVFEEGESGLDDELCQQFEAASRFGPAEKRVATAVLNSLIVQHEARGWAAAG